MNPFFLPCCGQPLHLESDLLNMGLEAFELKVQMREVLGFGGFADANGLSVGLYKWLVTWPPVPFKSGGFVVPAWLASSPDTWPDHLSVVKEIRIV